MAERGERADRAAELADQHARAQLGEPFAVALHGGEQRGHLEAEGERHRLLQVAAPRHRRIAIAPRQVGEGRGDRLHVRLDQVERGADLQDRRGVGDVLRGGAPMAPLAEPVGAEPDDLLHHAQDRIADALGLLLEASEVDVLDPALAHDLLRGLLGDDAEPSLRLRQRRLDLEVIADPCLVGENLPHLRSAENVAEDDGIEGRGGHVSLRIAGWASSEW